MFFETTRGDKQSTVRTSADGRENPPKSLALAFATIERPQVAQRLILSVRRRFPTLAIYVADQSLDVAAMSSFYAALNVTLVRMTYDSGVCASRNALVAHIKEDFFILCDDDFVLGDRTDFVDALRILEHFPDIGVVGGRLYDYNGTTEYTRNWELFLNLDVANRTLTSVPIYHYAPCVREIGSARFYMCDAVMNFAVMRRAIFNQAAIQWDERFKSNGEHEDFFLNIKLNSSVRVAYLPTMVAYHHHPDSFREYRVKLRGRVEGWRQMFEKWDIDQHLEIGLGVRSIDELDWVVDQDSAKRRFFLNDNLSLRRTSKAPALLVRDGFQISALGMLDEVGEPVVASPTARLLIHPSGGALVGGPSGPGESGAPVSTEVLAEALLQDRYAFLPACAIRERYDTTTRFLFRYSAVSHLDSEFTLWYRLVGEGVCREAEPLESGALPIYLRWVMDSGHVLIWESRPELLDTRPRDYWVPLSVEAPIFPKDCEFLRFEVITGGVVSRAILATGFVFKAGFRHSVVDSLSNSAALDVLALAPWVASNSGISPPSGYLDAIGRDSEVNVATRRCDAVPTLLLIPIADLVDMDALFIFGWEGLGVPLLSVDLTSREAPHSPLAVAIPRHAADFTQMVGLSRDKSYREIVVCAE